MKTAAYKKRLSALLADYAYLRDENCELFDDEKREQKAARAELRQIRKTGKMPRKPQFVGKSWDSHMAEIRE